MSMQVLQEKQQIGKARQELLNKGASFADSFLRSLIRKLGLVRGMEVGDMVKSWDILSTVTFLDSHVTKDEPILDIGCYASEVIVALHDLNYSNLFGIDLNPELQKMPYSDVIKYEIGNFMHTKYADNSFRVVTSISVIEHGFDGNALLKEVSRILQSGGYFIATFDYWSEKIDTDGIKIFGMDWKIFSRQEVLSFVELASTYGLFPVGALNPECKDRVINCGGKQYTFAWLALQKAENK